MGKKSAPPAPDYTAAAEKQAESSAQVTNQQTWANRPDIYTPWGSQTWQATPTYDPATGQTVQQWTSNISLSPDQQAALNSQMAIQNGRSDAALQLLGQATSAFQNPLDYSGLPQGGQSVYAPTLGGNVPQWSGGPNSIAAGDIQHSIGGSAPTQFGFGGSAPLQTDVKMGNIGGNSVSAQGANMGPLKYEMDHTAGDWRQRAQDAALAFQQPLIDRRRAARETQLANMGMTRGSEAWNAEMQAEADQALRDQYQAFSAGQSEANMLFGQDLQASQFTNNARQQEFNANAFNAQQANQAAIASANLAQQAQIQNAMNQLAQGQFHNQSAGQQFSQNMARGQFYNQAQQQDFSQQQARGQFANQAQQQEFAQNAANVGVANQAAQQDFDNLMRRAQYGDQAAMQQLSAEMQAGQFNQSLRSQALAEQVAQRSQPLNELNALLTGQQVGMPQMPGFSQANASQAVNYSGAAQNQYQAELDAQNMKSGLLGNVMGGLFGLGGAAIQGGGWGGLFNFSDARLKTDIVKLGSVDGVNVYEYSYIWGGPREIGVLAQEVPHAAAQHKSGYLMVDYSKVWK